MLEASTVPRVAVIIPVHGHLELLALAVSSVKRQRGVKVRLLVIDDASPDAVEPTVRAIMPEARVERLARQSGPGEARNKGLEFADGEFVAFLDADDEWEDDFLSRSVATIQNGGFAATVALSRAVFAPSFPLAAALRMRLFVMARNAALLACAALGPRGLPLSAFYLCQLSHAVFKRAAIAASRFGSQIGGEDWSFMLDVMGAGEVGVVPRRLVRYRFRVGSLSFRPLESARRRWVRET